MKPTFHCSLCFLFVMHINATGWGTQFVAVSPRSFSSSLLARFAFGMSGAFDYWCSTASLMVSRAAPVVLRGRICPHLAIHRFMESSTVPPQLRLRILGFTYL